MTGSPAHGPVVALSIAGSDSSGGAGVQADLKTFSAMGVFAATAITALTAQNTVGVFGVIPTPADFVIAQIAAVLQDLNVQAVKTGMLATAEIVAAVGDLDGSGRLRNLVVDPVMVSSSGDRLLDVGAERLYTERLLPLARVITPNLREAGVLVGESIDTLRGQRFAAERLAALGAEVVVVKGGHATIDAPGEAVDVVVAGGMTTELRAPRIDTDNNHGSGCSFSSAVAARLALGDSPLEAVEVAKRFVHQAIVRGARWRLGAGHGPLDHLDLDSRRAPT
ncbi:MAG: bifunctional hydroxymethylpyrimidine kinase/phosphomethylpyrimidine kinase [Acidimicrobiales bacterium]